MKYWVRQITEELKAIIEPSELTIFEIVGMSVFIITLILFRYFQLSLMSMVIVLASMMMYSYFKKGKTIIWKKIKV